MKRIGRLLCIALLVGGMIAPATATLIRDGDVIFDDLSGSYWYAVLPNLVNMTYDEQVSAIAALTDGYGSVPLTNWHMAGGAEMQSLWDAYSPSEIATVFDATYVYKSVKGTEKGWYGRYDKETDNGSHATYEIYYSDLKKAGYNDFEGATLDADSVDSLSAWATTGTPVPEPSTMMLLGTGIAGVVGFMWRRSRKSIL